jgi:hypothetical protein
MKNPFSDIDKALGVFDPVETAIQQNNIVVPKKVVKSNEDDIENDYKYQRENFYGLVERGQDAIEGILELAKEGEHPRAYEVAGNLIKQVAEVTSNFICSWVFTLEHMKLLEISLNKWLRLRRN